MAILDRMIRASRAEVDLYEEVEHDPGATVEALIVVAVTAAAGGIGAAIAGAGRPGGNPIVGLLIGIVSAVIGWAVFAGVTYFIGKQLFHADATWEEVLRTLGYAWSPMVAQILVALGALGGIVAAIAALWTLYLVFVGIRAALDIGSGQTVATIVLSIIPAIFISAIIQAPLMIAR